MSKLNQKHNKILEWEFKSSILSHWEAYGPPFFIFHIYTTDSGKYLLCLCFPRMMERGYSYEEKDITACAILLSDSFQECQFRAQQIRDLMEPTPRFNIIAANKNEE